jgi:DNA-binding NarL/FixJ family response regulator
VTYRIVLVDDNVQFLTTMEQFLKRFSNIELAGKAHGAQDALTMVKSLAPDLVLMDIAMPEQNGLELAQQMLSWNTPPNIILLSMYDGTFYRDAALEIGATGFVSKIDFVNGLMPIVDQLIAEKSAPGSAPGNISL